MVRVLVGAPASGPVIEPLPVRGSPTPRRPPVRGVRAADYGCFAYTTVVLVPCTGSTSTLVIVFPSAATVIVTMS